MPELLIFKMAKGFVNSGKYPVWFVNSRYGDKYGSVKWCECESAFCFFPHNSLFFSKNILCEIAKFCDLKTKGV